MNGFLDFTHSSSFEVFSAILGVGELLLLMVLAEFVRAWLLGVHVSLAAVDSVAACVTMLEFTRFRWTSSWM